MKQRKQDQLREWRLAPGAFVLFVKLFLVYVFLEFVMLRLSADSQYFLVVKVLGDVMLLAFAAYTLLKSSKIVFFKKQRLFWALSFAAIAAMSAFVNDKTFLDLALGLRVLFRFYIIYLLSFYYRLGRREFDSVSDFFIKSFYVEIVLFAVGFALSGSTSVLFHNYLSTGLYVNVVFALLLFRQRFNLHDLILLLLAATQAFLSTSRLAFIGVLLQSAIFIIFIWRKPALLKAVLVSLVSVVAFAFLAVTGVLESGTLSGPFEKIVNTEFDPSSNFRVFLLTHFTRLSIEETNLIGDGPNTFGTREQEDYHFALGFDERTIAYAADSHYTILLMSYGFLGVIVFYVFLVLLTAGADKMYRPLFLTFIPFLILASLALPAFSMRISSLAVFSFLSLARGDEG